MRHYRARRIAALTAAAVALAALLAVVVPARAVSDPQAKLQPALFEALAQGDAPMLVYFGGTADLSAAYGIADKTTRRRYVYDRLREQAARSQAAARGLAERAGAPVRPHYLLNMIEVSGDAALAQALAALPEVSRLALDTPASANLPLPQPEAGTNAPSAPAGIEWGVNRIHAPDVWITYTVRGEGIVVGTADTGVQWDHPALIGHYRGWNGITATHTLNWHDGVHAPAGVGACSSADNLVPCDGYGHGTHVTGIMVGDDGAGNQVGVAPGAQWIGCRNMDNSGNGSIARYTECFEFMLAPFPPGGNPLTDGHPELAADIVNNSWTCTPGEGCDSLHLNDLEAPIQSLNAASILVVAAASNYGSACSTVREPIGMYAEAFAAGATDIGDNIASFSSRGPVTVDGSNRMKPDISAPGVSVRSTYPYSGYNTLSGTSMASPHVAGAAALLWSAVPALTGKITETIGYLESTATPRTTAQGCGGDSPSAVPNNVYGYGIVNALAAIQSAASQYPTRTLRYYIPIFMQP
ncbi:MAG: S8 family serine peptidase [Chloroflexi bacterium]|nr:S8 family serine peptidase [Chloroflexota bacterium]